MHALDKAALCLLLAAACGASLAADLRTAMARDARPDPLDAQLEIALRKAGFTGRIESTLVARLGRPIDRPLADLGRKLFFDPIGGLHDDNTCAGCHAPAAGFGDTQSIAIGVQSNRVVGPGRQGPRNQRRTPTVVNTAFYPALMWNGRFSAPSGSPFDNSAGFSFPAPEGTTQFPPNDPVVRHLLIAQAHIPPTELNEAAGFTGTKGTLDPRFDVFDDGRGSAVPLPDGSSLRNGPIRAAVAQRLNGAPAYVKLFGDVFATVRGGAPIMDVLASARNYSPNKADVARDLTHRQGPSAPVLQVLDPLPAVATRLSDSEFEDLYRFVSGGLLDRRARPVTLCRLVPEVLPSGYRPLTFQGCER